MGRTRPPHLTRALSPWVRMPSTPAIGTSTLLEEAVNLKKVITWLVVAFVVFYVIQAPESSAQFVRNAANAVGDAATSLAQFVSNLT
jgi:large-conductance mechanosensitive channel